MTAIALAIVWYTLVTDEELKDGSKTAQNLGYSIAFFALLLIFMLALKDLFK